MEYVHSQRSRPPLPDGPWLVAGLARSGRSAALALRARDETVFGVDSGRPDEIEELVAAGVECHPESDGIELLDRVGTVVKSPGVPGEAPVIREARERGLTVIGELELGWRLTAGRMIAITGTNGKTTVTELVAHLFREAGRPVEAVGNLGRPLCELAYGSGPRPGPDTTVVCECSSFQLEDSVKLAPEVAVLLNLAPDHIDRHGDLAAYRQAKLRIFRNQVAGDVAILNTGSGVGDVRPAGEASVVRFATGEQSKAGDGAEATLRVENGTIRVDGDPLIAVDRLGLRGHSAAPNAMAAAAAGLACGLEATGVASALASFKPIPHRFQPVGEIEGVEFINNSKATNVAATLDALAGFDGGVHLILGGRGKGDDFGELVPAVRRACRGIYLIGESADQIATALKPARIGIVRFCRDLEDAVSEAAGAATPGETVLLAPAAASFDQFRNFKDRGEQFAALVEELDG